jgi:subtilisin family serine protease
MSDKQPRPRVRPEQAQPESAPTPRSVGSPAELVLDSVVSEPLLTVIRSQPSGEIGVIIELRSSEAAERARRSLAAFVAEVTEGRVRIPTRGTAPYVTVGLTAAEIAELARRDAGGGGRGARAVADSANPAPRRLIHRMWPNFEIGALMLRSAVATKCRAAQRTFDATGEGIVWAVLDSGIDAAHRHFARHGNLELPGGLEHRSFVPEVADPLADANGHGTHVAGIIAGGLAADATATGVGWYLDAQGNEQRQALPVAGITGMAPACRLLSCTVLRADRTGDLTALLDALLYVQQLNDGGRNLRVHGVNISVGHLFDPRWFAAGLTPVCREVDRLVASGVVVVVAAGNTGYGYAKDPDGRTMRLGFGMTINDPGNAARAVTVGSTSSSPHVTGVSYFSSKGPTGDGRMKPDLVAPGERVISAAAGELLRQARQAAPDAEYIESSGTSMAAPHVSGAAAGLLSVHREYIGDADRVKEVLTRTATDLGRARAFQGAGMLDALRALQSL